MWKYNHTDELCHYGISGMKWGRRKARINKGRSNRGSDDDMSPEARLAAKRKRRAKIGLGVVGGIVATVGTAAAIVGVVKYAKRGKSTTDAFSDMDLDDFKFDKFDHDKMELDKFDYDDFKLDEFEYDKFDFN